MKKIISFICLVGLLLGLTPRAFADSRSETQWKQAYQSLIPLRPRAQHALVCHRRWRHRLRKWLTNGYDPSTPSACSNKGEKEEPCLAIIQQNHPR